MEETGYRLAVLHDGKWHPHTYQDVFGMENGYLVAAPSRSPLHLAITLLDAMAPPYLLELEVLEAEGLPAEDGAVIQILKEADRDQLVSWIDEHAEVLQSDARLAVLVHGARNERIVYDEHNRLLLSGPIKDYEGVLLSQGLVPGEISVPMPHAHRYREASTPVLVGLITR